MRVLPAFLTHVAAFRKVNARVPSPLDILAEAAAMVAQDAAKSTAHSALDATATALVASPSLEFNVSLPDPYTDSDTSTVMIDDYAKDVCMDGGSCTSDTSFRILNLDDDSYFDSPRPRLRPRRGAAKKTVGRKTTKARSIGKENVPPMAKKCATSVTTRTRRMSSSSTASSSTISSRTVSPNSFEALPQIGNAIMDSIDEAMDKAIAKAKRSACKEIICDLCDKKSWRRSWDFKRHYLTHFKAVIGPIHCMRCKYTTIQNSNYERHAKKHLPRGSVYSAEEAKALARRYRFVENKHY